MPGKHKPDLAGDKKISKDYGHLLSSERRLNEDLKRVKNLDVATRKKEQIKRSLVN